MAHAYYPYELGHFGGDIHFDEDEDWNPEAKFGAQGLDFFTVAVITFVIRIQLPNPEIFL